MRANNDLKICLVGTVESRGVLVVTEQLATDRERSLGADDYCA